MKVANPRLVVARWLSRVASSAWEEGGRDPNGEGWDDGAVVYGLKSKEDMEDGSLVPPVRDSYGKPQSAPEVRGTKNLNQKAEKL
jgi:hypothetical protein